MDEPGDVGSDPDDTPSYPVRCGSLTCGENRYGMVEAELQPKPDNQKDREADNRIAVFDQIHHRLDILNARPYRKGRMRMPLAEIIEALKVLACTSKELI